MSSKYPRYRVVKDSYYGMYKIQCQKNAAYADWEWDDASCLLYWFKWSAIREVKRKVADREARASRTITQVWGPYP